MRSRVGDVRRKRRVDGGIVAATIGPKIITKEDLKKEVLRYLVNTATKKDWKIDNFTLSSIRKYVGNGKERVEEALEGLEEEDLIKPSEIGIRIYLPKTEKGERIKNILRKKKLIVALSPYAAFIIAILILTILAPYIVSNASAIQTGLLLALSLGLILAFILQSGLRELMKWRAVSKETYEDVARISKSSVILFLLFFGVYFWLTMLTESKVTPEGTIMIFLGSLPVAFSYAMWKKGK